MQKVRFLILLFFTLVFVFNISGQVLSGVILDSEEKTPLPFCNVYIPELHLGALTDIDGKFQMEKLPAKSFTIQFIYTGYSTLQLELNLKEEGENLEILLEKQHIELTEIVVSVPGSELTEDNITPVTKMGMKELNRQPGNSLMESAANLPGVDQVSTGTGIGKPVIRGLSSNRVVSYSQGIRIENQQWGDEHGLGIGSVGIRDVELIKGPNSLLYGSDAIGGVLYFNDEYYANINNVEGFLESTYLSNALSSQNNLGVKIHKKKYKQNFFGSYKSNADYMVPNGDRVLNTRFDEMNFKTSLGFNTKWLVSNIRYSYLENNFGITEEDSLYHNDSERNYLLPYQNIVDHKVSMDNKIFMGNSKLEVILGYTDNTRKEFEDSKTDPALNMHLASTTYNLRYYLPKFNDRHQIILGAQGMYQTNRNFGEEVLIPNANTLDNGVFGIWNMKFEKINFQTGVRYDSRRLSGLETAFGNNEVIDPIDRNFSNITYSLGGMYKANIHTIRLNFSSGFRAPNTSELLSDGEHEGSNRYEIGNADLKSEFASQVDLSYGLSSEHIELTLNPFYNSIQNYIYLNPTDSISGGKQVFYYSQQDALFTGGEIALHWHPHNIHWLHLESAYSYIMGMDENNENLPLIPANRLNSTFKVEFKEKGKFYVNEMFLQHILKSEQSNTALNEKTSPQYQLINIGLTAILKMGKTSLSFKAGVNNVLNTKYIDHLSRLKIYDVSGQGRNMYLGLRLDLATVLKSN